MHELTVNDVVSPFLVPGGLSPLPRGEPPPKVGPRNKKGQTKDKGVGRVGEIRTICLTSSFTVICLQEKEKQL